MKKKQILFLVLLLIIPVFFSSFLSQSKNKAKGNEVYKIVTYNNMFNKNIWEKDKLAYHILSIIDSSATYTALVIPEQTFRGFDSKNMKSRLAYHYFKKAINKKRFKTLFIGSTGYINKDTLVNSCIIITDTILYKKVKKKLIPFTEYIPPLFYPLFIKKFYRPDVKDDLKNIVQKLNIMPLICYEAFFPNYVSNNIGNANYIFLISSEKFMNNNTFALKQYDNIVRLRAIENRTILLKASNYGWSFITDPYGKILDKKNNELNYFKLTQNNIGETTYRKWGNKATLPFIFIFLLLSFLKKI
ncbi:MAG: hypothetical protein L3J09_11100 [Flavobacteriaceae bacterium]|nr:hypothetical protein [Flavobacteriaceae bacterium]